MKLALVITTVLALAGEHTNQSQTHSKFCGSSNLDIGRGFILNQYMSGGAPDYYLTVKLSRKDMSFKSAFLKGDIFLSLRKWDWSTDPITRGPSLGFKDMDARTDEQHRYEPFTIELQCGNDAIVSARYGPTAPPDDRPIRISATSLFSEWRSNPKVSTCLAAFQKSNRYRIAFYSRDKRDPDLLMTGKIDLRWAMKVADNRWKQETKRSLSHQCEIIPPPPPPF